MTATIIVIALFIIACIAILATRYRGGPGRGGNSNHGSTTGDSGYQPGIYTDTGGTPDTGHHTHHDGGGGFFGGDTGSSYSGGDTGGGGGSDGGGSY